jgi:hypothetical protein
MASGDLAGTPFPLLLKRLHHSGTTGALHVTAGPHTKRVFVHRGAVVFAASTDRNDRLGEMLLRLGEITLPQFLQCSAAISREKRFGTVLVEKEVIGPEKLVWAVKMQVKEIAFSLFGLPAGAWRFVPEEDAGEEMITLNINTPDLLKEGIGRMDSIARPIDTFYSLDLTLRLTKTPLETAKMLSLTAEESALVQALGSPLRLGQICGSSLLRPAPLLKFLWALLVLELLEVRAPAQDAPSVPGPDGLEDPEVTGADLADLIPPSR